MWSLTIQPGVVAQMQPRQCTHEGHGCVTAQIHSQRWVAGLPLLVSGTKIQKQIRECVPVRVPHCDKDGTERK